MEREPSIEATPRDGEPAAEATAVDATAAGARPLRAPRGPKLPSVRPIGDHNWLGSSFDLAQGLEVKEMVSKLSPETLDQLFRSS